VSDEQQPGVWITQEHFDNTLLQGFLLAYRIIYDVYDIEPARRREHGQDLAEGC
jgi:hypothetical protein